MGKVPDHVNGMSNSNRDLKMTAGQTAAPQPCRTVPTPHAGQRHRQALARPHHCPDPGRRDSSPHPGPDDKGWCASSRFELARRSPNETNGGSSETALNELQVSPIGVPPGSRVVTMATPVGNDPSTYAPAPLRRRDEASFISKSASTLPMTASRPFSISRR